MVREQPAIEKINTRVQRNDSDARENRMGITTRPAKSTTTPARPRCRDHQGARTSTARVGAAPASFHPPSSGVRTNREKTSTITNVATNSHSSVTPRSLGSTFCWSTTSTMPTATPATSVTGRLRIRATSATTSARNNNW